MFLARLRNVKQADKLTYSYQIPAKTLKQIGWRTVRLKGKSFIQECVHTDNFAGK